MFVNKELDICESYNYLGIQLRKCAENTLVEQAQKA